MTPVSERSFALLTALLLLSSLAWLALKEDEHELPVAYVPVWSRIYEDYNTTSNWSYVLERGAYALLPTDNEWDSTHVAIPVYLPRAEGGAAIDPRCLLDPDSYNCPRVSLAYWRPAVPAGETIPVIVEIGPYFGEDSIAEPGSWLGLNIINNILPHGFAFAQVSVLGTGGSNHCMDLMGNAEQLGVDAAVTWLGSQEWSNGNVGIIGKSYDGSTQWQAAQFGNPHLKTIVPISGLIGVRELMWRNGSSEARAPFMHNVVYGGYGFGGDDEDLQNITCPDYVTGPYHGVSGWATGGYEFYNSLQEGYWEERYFLPDVLENYEGSVYIIHGFQDWNVDPHMAVPTLNTLKDHGIEAKLLMGQWRHDYPDRPDSLDRSGRGEEAFPQMVRYDWMQDLLEWFTFYLREDGPKPNMWTEIQDNRGQWRVTDRYPQAGAERREFALGEALAHAGGSLQIFPGSPDVVFETEPFATEFRFGGQPQLHIDVTPEGSGGQLYALLEDCDDDSCIHVGHAIMDLRFYAGGTDYHVVEPGETINAKMEFLAMDVVIPPGHTLKLSLRSTGEDYLPASTTAPVAIELGASSVLRVDVVNPAAEHYYLPPQCRHPACVG
uniref:Putative X-Pro dipeptidyl-peptidase (S15 family) n=1 Tax=uncultured marine microorganism HF4000_ANIW137J11 TaxID=455532 RepID=B3T4P8_9ZZZZ|nr:putative X-Pro dipeptidyl-peptidase (S15 family) [uncultured marine microorganism HF4000_ANIW137J11]